LPGPGRRYRFDARRCKPHYKAERSDRPCFDFESPLAHTS
jgi:hypothetical protein